MQKIIKRINKTITDIAFSAKKTFDGILEEVHIIIRNRKYSSRYPALFAIFAIIEHEQSAQVFEVNNQDFKIIKDNIFIDEEISNHHILEALRGLFQNNQLIESRNKAKIRIAQYLFNEIVKIINSNDRYFEPLLKAVLHGFPFLLNYNNYELFRKLLQRKSRASLRLIKHILSSENFPDFLAQKQEIANIILASLKFDNKPAFMLLVRYLRTNNLIIALFHSDYFDIKSKILNIHSIEKRGIDYMAIMLAYYEDQWFSDKNHKKDLIQFLENIFSYQLGLKQKERTDNYHKLITYISMNKRLGYQNLITEKILEDVVGRFVDICSKGNKKSRKIITKYIVQSKAPATNYVKIREFFAMSTRYPEEYWLMKFAPYLL